MVNIVTALPPSDGKTAAKVGDEHGNQGVNLKVGCDGQVTSIVSSEHELMLYELVKGVGSSAGERLTQNNPRNTAEVRYHPLLRNTANNRNKAEYLAISFP